MNKVILIGNLVADPELRQTNSGTSVATFRIAVQRRFANANGVREADFISVIAWRQLGELVQKYLTKGRKCCVEGSIQTRSYDAQDGSKRYVTEVVADNIEFLPSGNRGEAAPLPEEPPQQSAGGYTQVDDDELPF